MTKIKVFNFEVSNFAYHASGEDLIREWYKKQVKKLVPYSDIEKILNKFLENKTLISLNVNTVDAYYHNNGRANIIQLVYTIIYSE
ncbi:hypothetical protein [Clostridium rectalis]|uniref:hypothetical protein n=1 Tax=Clostridium rectalis TaxID=2040295 RepID=UPI000F6429C5|nr:hypothetical protein [Clostridium rectalis]